MSLPYNEDAERTLVLKLLLDPKQINLIADKLSPTDFYVADYRDAYAAMLRLTQENKPIHIVSLDDAAGRRLELRLEDLSEGHTGTVEDYIGAIRDSSLHRRIVAVGEAIRNIGLSREGNPIARIQDEVSGLVRGTETGGLYTPAAIADSYLGTLEARRGGLTTGFKYGMIPLDQVIQPASPGNMIVVCARPSVGKTAFAENIAEAWSRQTQHPILFASVEMDRDSLMDRYAARWSGVAAQKIIRGEFDEEEYERIRKAVDNRRHLNVWPLDDGYSTTLAIRSAAAKTRLLAGGLGGIVVDYLQIVKDNQDLPEVTRVTRMSGAIKAMAREFQVPVLVLSQLNRQAEYRNDKHPLLADLRESGAIEQDADLVLGLYRPHLSSPDMDVDILKNRQGQVGRIGLYFDKDHVKFEFPPRGHERPVLVPDDVNEALEF